MIVKQEFQLLKSAPNILHYSKSDINKYSIENGVRKITNVIEMLGKIEHFSKPAITKQLSPAHINELAVVSLDDYPLHISYNEPTKQILINISPFG